MLLTACPSEPHSLCSPSFLLVLICGLCCVCNALHDSDYVSDQGHVQRHDITNTAQDLSVTAPPRLKMDQTTARMFFLRARKEEWTCA